MAPLMRFRWHILAAVVAALLVWATDNNSGLFVNNKEKSCMRAETHANGSIQPGTPVSTNKGSCVGTSYSQDRNGKHVVNIKNHGGPKLCLGGSDPVKANKCPPSKTRRDVNRVAYVQRRDDDEDKWPDCDCDGKKKKCDCDCDCKEEHKKVECKDKPKPDYSNYPPDMLWTRIEGDCKKYPGSTLWRNDNGVCLMKKGTHFVTAKCHACDPDQLWQIQPTLVVTQAPVTHTVEAEPVTVTAEPETHTVTKEPEPVTVTAEPETHTVTKEPVTETVTTTQVIQVTPTPTPTCQVHTDCQTGYRCCNQWDNQCYPQCRSDYDCGAGYFCAANYWHCYPRNSQYYSGYHH